METDAIADVAVKRGGAYATQLEEVTSTAFRATD